MTTYNVLYLTQINAEDKKDLYDKANNISRILTKKIHKPVEPHSYVELSKKDIPIKKYMNTVQQKLA